MNGMTSLKNALEADVDFMAYIDNGPRIAQVEPSSWGVDEKNVIIYQAGIIDNTIDYLDNTLTVNCRAETFEEALIISGLVVAAINRNKITGGGRFYCSQLAPILPADETDSVNAPVEVQIKGSKSLD